MVWAKTKILPAHRREDKNAGDNKTLGQKQTDEPHAHVEPQQGDPRAKVKRHLLPFRLKWPKHLKLRSRKALISNLPIPSKKNTFESISSDTSQESSCDGHPAAGQEPRHETPPSSDGANVENDKSFPNTTAPDNPVVTVPAQAAVLPGESHNSSTRPCENDDAHTTVAVGSATEPYDDSDSCQNGQVRLPNFVPFRWLDIHAVVQLRHLPNILGLPGHPVLLFDIRNTPLPKETSTISCISPQCAVAGKILSLWPITSPSDVVQRFNCPSFLTTYNPSYGSAQSQSGFSSAAGPFNTFNCQYPVYILGNGRNDKGKAPEDEGGSGPLTSRAEKGKDAPEFAGTWVWVCPFFRINPRKHYQCLGKTHSKIAHLKWHIYNDHQQPLYCAICFDEFANETDRDHHIRELTCSNLYRRKRVDGLTTNERLGLKKCRITESKDGWRTIWDIIVQGRDPLPKLSAREPRIKIEDRLKECMETCAEVFRWERARSFADELRQSQTGQGSPNWSGVLQDIIDEFVVHSTTYLGPTKVRDSPAYLGVDTPVPPPASQAGLGVRSNVYGTYLLGQASLRHLNVAQRTQGPLEPSDMASSTSAEPSSAFQDCATSATSVDYSDDRRPDAGSRPSGARSSSTASSQYGHTPELPGTFDTRPQGTWVSGAGIRAARRQGDMVHGRDYGRSTSSMVSSVPRTTRPPNMATIREAGQLNPGLPHQAFPSQPLQSHNPVWQYQPAGPGHFFPGNALPLASNMPDLPTAIDNYVIPSVTTMAARPAERHYTQGNYDHASPAFGRTSDFDLSATNIAPMLIPVNTMATIPTQGYYTQVPASPLVPTYGSHNSGIPFVDEYSATKTRQMQHEEIGLGSSMANGSDPNQQIQWQDGDIPGEGNS